MVDENDPQSDSGQTDLSLTAIIDALNTEDVQAGVKEASGSAQKEVFDPNATMDYKQAGISYPELPFADESNGLTNGASANMDSAFMPSDQQQSNKLNGQFKGDSLDSFDVEESAPIAEPPKRAIRGSRARAARKAMDANDYADLPSSFQPVDTTRANYKIRGGGRSHKFKLRSPLVIIASIVLLAVGAGIFYTAYNTATTFVSGNTGGTEFDITTDETRAAIDSRVPILVDYVDYSIEDTVAYITETGQFVYTNDRYQPDSPDASASGSEMVSMPQEMTDEQMAGYYEGSYNAYSTAELTDLFNGMYVIDMARGDLGSWNKLRYVNLNATSLEDEMAHLAGLQGLADDTVTISDEGTDTRGNQVIQGQKVVGETVYYFKIAACLFSDVYDAESLTDSSVYITCTLATYDFYTGSDEITPA